MSGWVRRAEGQGLVCGISVGFTQTCVPTAFSWAGCQARGRTGGRGTCGAAAGRRNHCGRLFNLDLAAEFLCWNVWASEQQRLTSCSSSPPLRGFSPHSHFQLLFPNEIRVVNFKRNNKYLWVAGSTSLLSTVSPLSPQSPLCVPRAGQARSGGVGTELPGTFPGQISLCSRSVLLSVRPADACRGGGQ